MALSKKKVYISGAVGNHLLRCFIAIANSIEDGYEIGALVASLQPITYLEAMLEVKVPLGSQKVGGLANDIDHVLEENVHRLFKYRDRILKEGWIKLKKVKNFIFAELCVHVRGLDKKVAPLQWYYDKIRSEADKYTTAYVCTDDGPWGESLKLRLADVGVKNLSFTCQNDIRDWFTILKADKVYCAAESFTLSTLLFNPNKEMIVCSRKSSTHDYRTGDKRCELPFVEVAMEYCPNLRFED